MTYNLESLVQILERILHPPHHHHPLWVLDSHKKQQIESLLEEARFLKHFSENSSSAITHYGKPSLESRIRDAAYDAEDVLESHLVGQILSCSEGESFIFSPPDLEKVIGELHSAKEEMMTVMDSSQVADTSSAAAVSSSRQDPNPKNIIVGVGEDLIRLQGRLIGQQPKALEVIPIVGMGGIGKTTMARNLYDDPSVISHFDTRAWATISQDYNKQKLRHVLLSLLGCVIGKPDDALLRKTDDELALCLHQALMGRRYLIVLDDVWDVMPWDDTRRFFPDENNGSRIIVTTRESSVADYTSSESSHHQMNLLKDDDSWNLLRQKVFVPEETCSSELENVGKKIAKDCRGLPLAIHVIGGILSQAKTNQDFWEQVSDNVSSTVADKDEHFSNILSLSYNHLPNHLKPCFLYMGAFPEDYEIRSSRLINLLVAEGLVRPISDKSLEEAAKMHLKALVDRNLIFVRQQGTNGKVKSYSIHDLLRDLCVRKAHEEKFLFVHGWTPGNLPINTSYLHRVCTHEPFSYEDANRLIKQIRPARSFLLFNGIKKDLLRGLIFELRLLRVLDILREIFYEVPEEILQLVNLRYLAVTIGKALPSSISKLWNLQTLIARHGGLIRFQEPDIVMPGILDMPELRHIKMKGSRTYVEYHGEDKNRFVVLDKLQTLSPVPISEITDRALETLPNIEKLGIFWDGEVDHVRDLSRLHKLHTLNCRSYLDEGDLLSNLIFPPSLKKLTLRRCPILDHHMNEIGKLPNLEILKLRECDFQSGESMEAEDDEFYHHRRRRHRDYDFPSGKWEANDGQFCQLQFLLMEELRLVNWVADDTHFPRLEHLVIRRCRYLEEIPLAIGDIPTLKVIEVDEYSSSAVDSAREIQEAQLDNGNDDLQVRILGYY
ncbi:UNVERIFIED_CONTAM: putative late blight resistance proteinR1B-12 [Sesamum radiatum]|uniref:Late blight resistance proteinR1B-12 n=1 Tax=Sesamum radiatum TaxID=300843 RepID=A0AAW2MWI5_SESRA